MKKIIIILLLFSSTTGMSQIIKNKLAIDLNMEYNPFVGYEDTAVSRRNFALGVNYSLGKRFSAELLTGYSKYDYSYSLDVYDDYNSYTTMQLDYRINKFSIALGINYYFKKQYAPIGNSIGLFYKVNKYIVSDNDAFKTYLNNKSYIYGGNLELDENQNNIYSTSYIGAKLSLVTMLSNKSPVYLKYGVNLAVPISNISYGLFKFKDIVGNVIEPSSLLIVIAGDYNMETIELVDYFKFNIGIGYLF